MAFSNDRLNFYDANQSIINQPISVSHICNQVAHKNRPCKLGSNTVPPPTQYFSKTIGVIVFLISFLAHILNPGYLVLGSLVQGVISDEDHTYHRRDFKGDWPRSDRVNTPGDIMIGALMMIHSRENDPIHCGEVMPQGGIQALEAMLYTIDWVNNNSIIPYTKLGAIVFDDCDKDTYGLQKAVHFIKGNMERLDDQGGDYTCLRTVSGGPHGLAEKIEKERKEGEKPITAVVAASSSVTSIQVANLLKLFKIPQVSFFSTSAELNNTERFPFFFRTIPSDEYQVKAMVQLIRSFNWTYVSVIYEESSYGQVAFDTLEKMLGNFNICIAVRDKLAKDSDVAPEEQYMDIARKLKKADKAKGVVIYGSDQEVRGLVKAIDALGVANWFTFIGSDGWSARELVYKGGYEDVVLGTISVQPMASQIPGFNEYFEALNPATNIRNPWFYEFWEKEFKCRYEPFAEKEKNEKYYPDTPNNAYPVQCNGTENMRHTYQYEAQLQFVSDAVLVLAYGFRRYLEHQCPTLRESCVKRQYPRSLSDNTRVNGTLLRDMIRQVEFTGLTKQHFKFFHNGPLPRYNIIHFRRHMATNLSTWMVVGNYTEHGLYLNRKLTKFYTKGVKAGETPTSVCAEPCAPGYRIIGQSKGIACCWSCDVCPARHFLYNRTTCKECPPGSYPDRNRMTCIQSRIERVQLFSFEAYALSCLAVAFIGLNVSLVILIVFLRHNSTPMVKASGRELSYVIMVGLFMCFGMTPLMLLTPSVAVCALQRIFSGFCFTVVYAAILTKTNRIARIFRSGRRTTRRPVFISPQSQLLICSVIASVQVVIVGVWLYVVPPQDILVHPDPESTQHVCAESVSYAYLISYTYPILLCVVCTFYACQTRKIPEAFNESKYIGAAVYTTCIIWISFVPIYFTVKDNMLIRTTSVSISTSLTAMVCQVCLFLPKLYVILFRPERNVRQNLMGTKSMTSGGHGSSQGSMKMMPVPLTQAAVPGGEAQAAGIGGGAPTFRSDSSGSLCSQEALLDTRRVINNPTGSHQMPLPITALNGLNATPIPINFSHSSPPIMLNRTASVRHRSVQTSPQLQAAGIGSQGGVMPPPYPSLFNRGGSLIRYADSPSDYRFISAILASGDEDDSEMGDVQL